MFSWAKNQEQYKKRLKSGTQKWAITVVSLAPHHKVPQTDKNGMLKTRDDGTPYYNIYRCDYYGRNKECTYCKDTINFPYVLGRKYYWSFGKNHRENLEGITDQISQRCNSCGVGTVFIAKLTCANCGAIIADINSGLSDNDMNDRASLPCLCYNCNYTGYTIEAELRCNRCQQPKRQKITDRVLWLGKQGEKMDSEVVLVSDCSITEFDPVMQQWSSWGVTGTTQELLDKIGAPIDFDNHKEIGRKTLIDQAEFLECNIPPELQAAAQQQTPQQQIAPGNPQQEIAQEYPPAQPNYSTQQPMLYTYPSTGDQQAALEAVQAKNEALQPQQPSPQGPIGASRPFGQPPKQGQ